MNTLSKKTITLTLLIILVPAMASASYYGRGKKYYAYKKYEKAKEMFLKSVEKHPIGNAYYFLGEIEKIQQHYEKAEEYYKLALEQKYMDKNYLKNTFWNLIVLIEQRADYEEVTRVCIKMWDRLHDTKAKEKIEKIINKHLWTNNQKAKEIYLKAIHYKTRGNLTRAKELFTKAINIDSTFFAPGFELGMMAYRQNNLDEAIMYLNPIANHIPFYGEVHMILAQIHYTRNNYKGVIDHFNKAEEFAFLSKTTNYYLLLKRGTAWFNLHNYDEATKDIQSALKLRPKALKPLLLLTAISIKKKDYDNALSTLHRANKVKPNNPMILFQIGSIYYKKDDWRYLSYFDRLYEIIKNKKSETKYTKVLTILIRAHFKKNNLQRVNQLLKDLPADRYNYETTLLTAKTHYGLKEYDKAVDYFEKISLNDSDKFQLCKSYYLSGRKEKSKEMISSLRYNKTFMEKVNKDSKISAVFKAMEKEEEQKRIEEEKKRKEAEQKRLEEEKKQKEEALKKQKEQARLEKEKKEALTNGKQITNKENKQSAETSGPEEKKTTTDQNKSIQ